MELLDLGGGLSESEKKRFRNDHGVPIGALQSGIVSVNRRSPSCHRTRLDRGRQPRLAQMPHVRRALS